MALIPPGSSAVPIAVLLVSSERRRSGFSSGFTLVELMLAAALGALLFLVALQLLLGEARQSSDLARHLLLRRLQHRTLQLIKDDLASASFWRLDPAAETAWSCPLAGRQPLIAITPRHGGSPVVYSLGTAPSAIWRGSVLMRCGPAFDLQGRTRHNSTYQNRVVLDAVEALRFTQPIGLPVLRMQLIQKIPGREQTVVSSAVG